MKGKILSLFFVFTVLLLSLVGCKKDSNNPVNTNDQFTLTQEEKQQIINTNNEISASADSLMDSDDPIQKFSQMLSYYKNLPGVENAWVTNQGLFIRYKKGGVISYNLGSDVVVPPYDNNIYKLQKSTSISGTNELIGNTKACLINQQYNDDSRQYCKDVINELNSFFTSNNYAVTIKNGAEVNLDFIAHDLKDFGAIFYISHGCYDGTNTWICTGEEGSADDLLQNHFNEWHNKEISLGTVKEGRWLWGLIKKSVTYYNFSENYIKDSYKDDDFPHSLIYLVACQGLKSNELADAFHSKGAAVVAGWDETNCLGQSTGKLLFEAMLGGKDLKDAFDDLPAESKISTCEVSQGANLIYIPSSGGTVQLVNPVAAYLHIDEPINGQSYSERTISLDGYLINGSTISNGTVELNGVTTVLVYSGINFSQPLELNRGINIVKIGCNGILQSGEKVHVDSTISFNGDFPVLDLWTELRWNTNYSDVDFHLLPPNSTINDLWTSKDCFFFNKSTSWGGELDVDDIDGYGPEHITIPGFSTSGTYRLFVNYYDDHDAGASDASVTVSVKDGTMQHFGPYHLENDGGVNHGDGDLWEVCTISFPSGQITPVNKYYFLGSLAKGNLIKGKR